MEKKRGRPLGSTIRKNLVDILWVCKSAYGYELYKYYCDLFPHITMRVIYYHLKKGILTGEFEVKEIKREKGEYSWGESADKIYYKLGPFARPIGNQKVEEYFRKRT